MITVVISLERAMEDTPLVYVEVDHFKAHRVSADLAERGFLKVEAEGCTPEAVGQKPGIESVDSGDVAGVGQENRVAFFIEAVVFRQERPGWGEVAEQRPIQLIPLFRRAEDLKQHLSMVVRRQIVEVVELISLNEGLFAGCLSPEQRRELVHVRTDHDSARTEAYWSGRRV